MCANSKGSDLVSRHMRIHHNKLSGLMNELLRDIIYTLGFFFNLTYLVSEIGTSPHYCAKKLCNGYAVCKTAIASTLSPVAQREIWGRSINCNSY